MRDLKTIEFNPLMEDVVQILADKCQNADVNFFRIMLSYYLSKIASMMRVKIDTADMHNIPVNMYAVNLAVSGSGKGRSINIIEDQVINGFKEVFMEQTFPAIATQTLYKLAVRRGNKNNTDPDKEVEKLEAEFEATGPMVFSFDSGTSAAVKQMRHKLLLAGSGSMNMEIDEIGSNLLGNVEVLTAFLELFDIGKIKQKLTKHTRENLRSTELYGNTPANMLLFGTPTKLLDGAKTEQEFMDMLEIGYARRSFFGYSRDESTAKKYSASEIYDIFTDVNADHHLMALSDQLAVLAEPTQFNQVMKMDRDVTLEKLEYRLYCEDRASHLSEYEEIRRAELKHRYFKVAKLAGVYAFVEQSQMITEDHLYHAIALAEESGKAFDRILRRDRSYARLANYICTINREVTQADLVEDLPFYRGSESQKKDMMKLAIAHGYRHNQVIKINTVDDIDFFKGESLPETNLDEMIFSYSRHDITKGYTAQEQPFNKLHQLCSANTGIHWVNHHLAENVDYSGMGGYRDEMHVVPGFNLLVLDVDDGTKIDTAKTLMEDYTFLLHTTKRHTEDNNRFRMIFPLSHTLKMDNKEYKQFMRNVYNWLPLGVDEQTNQRSRKWLSHKGYHLYNYGDLIDATLFIPKTKKADEQKAVVASQTNLTALERWFVNNTQEGNRNNQLLKYALACVDMKQDVDSVRNNVIALNEKLQSPLEEKEILSTIMTTVMRKITERNNP